MLVLSKPIFVSIYRQLKIFSDFSSLEETNNGSVIGYDQVVAYQDNNGEGGKTVSDFINDTTVCCRDITRVLFRWLFQLTFLI
jgi:hypothetical protein